MMWQKRWFLTLILAMIISLGVLTLKGFGTQQQLEETEDLGVISERIEEILKNQQDIIARLEDIRDQQDIIRIRASRR